MLVVKRRLDLNIMYCGCPSNQFHTTNIVQVKYKKSPNEKEQFIIRIYNSLATQYEIWTSPRSRGWQESPGLGLLSRNLSTLAWVLLADGTIPDCIERRQEA